MGWGEPLTTPDVSGREREELARLRAENEALRSVARRYRAGWIAQRFRSHRWWSHPAELAIGNKSVVLMTALEAAALDSLDPGDDDG